MTSISIKWDGGDPVSIISWSIFTPSWDNVKMAWPLKCHKLQIISNCHTWQINQFTKWDNKQFLIYWKCSNNVWVYYIIIKALQNLLYSNVRMIHILWNWLQNVEMLNHKLLQLNSHSNNISFLFSSIVFNFDCVTKTTRVFYDWTKPWIG